MIHETKTSRLPHQSLSDDEAWEALKRRRQVGQVVSGTVERRGPFGAFVDIGERFPVFVDPLDLRDVSIDAGDRCAVRLLQFVDDRRQIRATVADGAGVPESSPSSSPSTN